MRVMAHAEKEPQITPAWMNPKDAAAYLGVSVSSFYRGVMDNVDARRLGGRTVVSRASLDSYMSKLPKQQRPGLRNRRTPSPAKKPINH